MAIAGLDYAVELLIRFVKINTSNPPGDVEEAILFLEEILKKTGIHADVFMPVSGKANLLARIRGKRKGSPSVLLSHVDVVPATAEGWDANPFGGEIRDGCIYGRGTIDMKAQTICQLLSFMALHKEGITPERDVLFLATCDEEVGGQYGVEYMLDEVAELRDTAFVLSEGGFIVEEEGLCHAQVSVAEKKLSQFGIKAKGTGGHGSTPHKDNANEKVVRASHAILSHKWPLKATTVVNTYLNGVFKGKKWKDYTFTNLREALENKAFTRYVENNPVYNALLRNTVTLTMLKGGEKVNVIPTESHAYFDARLLPTESRERFFNKIRRLAGRDIEVTHIGSGVPEPSPSGYNTEYFKGVTRVIQEVNGPIQVLPFLTTGATDLRYFRNLGIPAYGFFPATLSKEEHMRMHGANERISIKSFGQALEGTQRIVKFLATMSDK